MHGRWREHPDRRVQGRLRRRRRRAGARRTARLGQRGAADYLREDAAHRRHPAHGQTERRARHGAPLRGASQLSRSARRPAQAARARLVGPRRTRGHADAAGRPAGHRQDPLRPAHRRTALHRLRLRVDEFAHRRLGALRIVVAVEERQAGQGVRHLPQRPVRQPGDDGRRDRQGRRRLRSTTRSVRSTRCSSTTPRASSSTSSWRSRSTPPASAGSPPPTRTRAFPSRSSTG